MQDDIFPPSGIYRIKEIEKADVFSRILTEDQRKEVFTEYDKGIGDSARDIAIGKGYITDVDFEKATWDLRLEYLECAISDYNKIKQGRKLKFPDITMTGGSPPDDEIVFYGFAEVCERAVLTVQLTDYLSVYNKNIIENCNVDDGMNANEELANYLYAHGLKYDLNIPKEEADKWVSKSNNVIRKFAKIADSAKCDISKDIMENIEVNEPLLLKSVEMVKVGNY